MALNPSSQKQVCEGPTAPSPKTRGGIQLHGRRSLCKNLSQYSQRLAYPGGSDPSRTVHGTIRVGEACPGRELGGAPALRTETIAPITRGDWGQC